MDALRERDRARVARGSPRARPGAARASGATLRVALASASALALSACAFVPPGLVRPDPHDDRSAARAPPPEWRRLAVVPFAGDAAHRRPAEELVSAGLQRLTGLAVVPPYAVERGYRRAAVDAEAARADVERWLEALVEDPGAAPRDELRALAARLEVDAVVIGRVAPGGARTDLAVVDASSGDPVAALRRAAVAGAAREGVHELAMSGVRRALADLVVVLRTRPGEVPRLAREEPPPRGDDPP